MTEVPSSLVDAISRVDAALASSGLPYAFGGALALSAWAEPRATREAIERGMFVGLAGEYRVDVFVPSIPFYDEARRRICRVPFLDGTFPVLSPETLAVFKLLFFRPKDLVDLQRLLEIRGSEFDAGFVRAAVAGMMGEDDRRIEEWDRIVRAVSDGP